MSEQGDVHDGGIRAMLEHAVPFRFLRADEREELFDHLVERTVGPGVYVYRQGDPTDDVYLLDSGIVETVDTAAGSPVRINRITAGHYFGERACLFSHPREYGVRATDSVRVFSMTGSRFLQLVHGSRAFAQSLGTILRERQDIFAAFDRFTTEVYQGLAGGTIDIRRLIPFYQALHPALHPGADDPSTIDFGALQYAVSRLPDNVTRSFVYLLTDDLPFEFSRPAEAFSRVYTRARRRNVWEMLPGKNMVLLRNGLSDLTDLLTCLCLYAVEARKIRKRVSDPETLRDLGGSEACKLPPGLPFTEAERAGLAGIWPGDCRNQLRQMVLNREAISVDIRRQTQSYNSRRTDLWTHQIGRATRELLGLDPTDMPRGVSVHIISSNTHSVSNCLNPFFARAGKEILEWGRSTGHPDLDVPWDNELDAVYSVARDYLAANPEAGPTVGSDRKAERDCGILRLEETVSTGIQVQLIDMQRLADYPIDPKVGRIPSDTRSLIVNIDYAFGEQAEEIIRNLVLLYGRNLASINVLGKAGSLVGRRGDVLVPTAFIEQSSDRFYPFGENVRCDLERLQSRVPARDVHTGPLLTVAGTLLQNRMMLHFYRHMWDCIGLEMEGTHYYRQILESQQLDVLASQIPLRFLYYVSDLPLDPGADLSASMSSVEGIPPLYAITREILCDILQGEREKS